MAAALGIGAIVLQRWIAATRFDAIIYVAIWFAAVGAVATAYSLRRRELRIPVLGTYVAILAVSGAVGYWWGFRDHEVNEKVAMASASIAADERAAALAAGAPSAGEETPDPGQANRDQTSPASGSGSGRRDAAAKPSKQKPSGPVSLAKGSFSGADGHVGQGEAEVVRTSAGKRLLTFTDFDVDPGAKVVVWLTREASSVGDRIELGNLKGNVGNQQYEIPSSADLSEYDTVVLYCTPFTVRIATAGLR